MRQSEPVAVCARFVGGPAQEQGRRLLTACLVLERIARRVDEARSPSVGERSPSAPHEVGEAKATAAVAAPPAFPCGAQCDHEKV